MKFRLCLKIYDRDEPTEVTDYNPSDGDVDEKEREEKLERINVIHLRPRSASNSSTSRSKSEYRRYQRTAQKISSGAVCRHLKIAGRFAGFTVFSGYPPQPPKLQHIHLTASRAAAASWQNSTR